MSVYLRNKAADKHLRSHTDQGGMGGHSLKRREKTGIVGQSVKIFYPKELLSKLNAFTDT